VTHLVLTPSQTSGPLFGFCLVFEGSDRAAPAESGAAGDGTLCLAGKVVDGAGRPYRFPLGLVEVWHGDQWARARTDDEGMFRVHLRRPAPTQTGDGQFLAPYFNIAVFGVGLLKQFVTRVYFPDDPEANRKDAVLRLVPEEDREKLTGTLVGDGTLQFQIVLQGARETPSFGW
jgi:protocatechuate 3,4-dioxygenase, alpha subunit